MLNPIIGVTPQGLRDWYNPVGITSIIAGRPIQKEWGSHEKNGKIAFGQ
jgi:hypothetical protein